MRMASMTKLPSKRTVAEGIDRYVDIFPSKTSSLFKEFSARLTEEKITQLELCICGSVSDMAFLLALALACLVLC